MATREHLPTGIRREKYGFRAYVSIRGRLHARRFPADTALDTMTRWRELARAEGTVKALKALEQHPPVKNGTLAGDAQEYLALKKGMTTYDTRVQMIGDWVTALGRDRDRETVTPRDVATVLRAWQDEFTYSASTLNHYRSALSDLFARLDPMASNPVRSVKHFRERKLGPRGLDPNVVAALFAAMPDQDEKKTDQGERQFAPSKARAMLEVLYTTGLSPAQIRRLVPMDIDLAHKRILDPGREKGEGTEPRWKPLTSHGVQALQRFAAAKAWGGVHRVTLLLVFRRAAAEVRRQHPTWRLPDQASPYWLRHSIGTTMLASTDNIFQTQIFMGHKDVRTTMRYVGGAIGKVERRAVQLLDRALAAQSLPPIITPRPISGRRKA